MYICTDTIEDILLSISAMLSCSQQQIEVFSRNLYCGCEENSTIYMDRIRNKVNDFITTHAIAEVDMVCMHHLTRRLNGFPEEEGEGKNLHDLLLSESALTKFLASYHINFTSNDETIRMIYKGQEIPVGGGSPSSMRLKLRFGQFENGYRDHCINGFALADRIEKTGYYFSLSRGPEILSDIAEVINLPEMLKDYMRQSRYYRYTFLLPIKSPIMDNKHYATISEKILMLLTVCFCRIYDLYCVPNRDRWYDHDNILMRLSDQTSIPAEFLLSKTLIDDKTTLAHI